MLDIFETNIFLDANFTFFGHLILTMNVCLSAVRVYIGHVCCRVPVPRSGVI